MTATHGQESRPAAIVVRSQTAKILSCAWRALALATILLLPFLNKPFLIDDPHFLAMARQIVRSPRHPMDFESCWNLGNGCTKAYALTPGNTLMGYALVPTVLLGSHEWVAHVTQLVFVWTALLAATSLALRLGFSEREAMTAALLIAAVPPLLPMASTAMPDVLAAALATVGIERLLAWKQEGRWIQCALAAVALGLAGIARAHLVLLLPLGALLLFNSIDPRKMIAEVRRDPTRWVPVAVGACILVAILLLTRERSLVLDPPSVFTGRRNIPRNLRSYFLYFCVPMPLAVYWTGARWRIQWLRVAGLGAIAVLSGLKMGDVRICFAVAGLGVISELIFEALRNRDHMGVFLSLWLLIPFPIVYYGHLPIKYLLPAMPAVVLICLRLAKTAGRRFSYVAAATFIIGGAIYSLLILRADAELAEFGRSAMYQLVQPHAAAGQTVWYGGDFSAYWYGNLAGGKVLHNDTRPNPGDLLAVGIFEGGELTLDRFPNKTLIQTIRHTYRFGRTMGAGMGLYTNIGGGTWLWGFGESDRDRYELWRID